MSKEAWLHLSKSSEYLLEMARHRLADNLAPEIEHSIRNKQPVDASVYSEFLHVLDLIVSVQCLNEYIDLENDF